MVASILNGQHLAQLLRQKIADAIHDMICQKLRPPSLAVILAGDDPASHIYVSHKKKACDAVGITSRIFYLPNEITTDKLLNLITTLNEDKTIDGILVQLPLPQNVDTSQILEKISIYKDVDGFHPYNLGRLAQRNPLFRPCTPQGIVALLNAYHLPSKGKHAVIVSASNIVGRPMAFEFLTLGATVTICHRLTKNLKNHIKMGDIIVAAAGVRNLIKTDWLQPNQILIDVGMHRKDGKVCGDILFEEALKKVAWLTPVPGGVGPMTVTALLQNTMLARTLNKEG